MNEKGLVVKDKYLFAKALNIVSEDNITNCKCSKGYIQRNGIIWLVGSTHLVEEFLKMPKNWPTYLQGL